MVGFPSGVKRPEVGRDVVRDRYRRRDRVRSRKIRRGERAGGVERVIATELGDRDGGGGRREEEGGGRVREERERRRSHSPVFLSSGLSSEGRDRFVGVRPRF